MGFYYTSIFSIVPLGIAYGILALLFWGAAHTTRGIRRRGVVLGAVGVVFLLLPISEELWIAWNFGQACKEAGTFIHKKVQVEGFYDSTMRTGYESTKAGRYRFVEHPTKDRRGTERVELASDTERQRALAWYAETNPGKERPKDRSVFYPLNDKQVIAVLPNGIDAWKVTRLDRPTARYHYTYPYNNTRVAHKVDKNERQVIDAETKQVLAQELSYGRHAPWFFIGLDAPVKICYGKRAPDIRDSLYVYVLLPSR